MPNVSYNELQKVLEKSGLPLNDSAAMGQAMPFAKQQIQGSMGGPDQSYANEYKAKLAKIAEMDQRLHKTYSDPNSNLFIEDPGAREGIYSGASNGGYQDLNRLQKGQQQSEKDYEDKINEAASFYKTLGQAVKKQEAAAKKKGGTGNSLLKKLKDANAKAAYGLTSEVGITDSDAINTFITAPVDFQKTWMRDVLSGNTDIPEGGFTEDDVKANLDEWNKKFGSKSKTAKTSILDQLRGAEAVKRKK